MSESALMTSVAASCLPILLTFGLSVASAQCSQVARLEAAFSAPPAASVPSNPPVAAGSEPSSSPETASGVRFATGSTITVLEDTPLQVITDSPISSRTTKAGARLPFTVTRDVIVGGILVIPCGARVYGTVVSAKQAGRLAGASNLTLELTELNLGDRTYPLYTPPFKVVGQSKTRPTVNKVATGAAVGAVAMDVMVPTSPYPVSAPARAEGDAIMAGAGAASSVHRQFDSLQLALALDVWDRRSVEQRHA